MKKTLLIALLLIATVGSVFAADFSIGLSSGFSQEIIIPEGGDSNTWSIVPLDVDFLVGFGDHFALNVTGGMNFGLDESFPGFGFGAEVLAYYNLPLTEAFNLMIGGGLSYDYLYESRSEMGGTVSQGIHMLGLLASVRVQYDITDFLAIFGGANVGYNLWNGYSSKAEVGGISRSDSGTIENTSFVPWALKVGVSYKF